MANRELYQLYAELDGVEPTIWRRFRLPGTHTVAELGYTLMVLYGLETKEVFRLEQVIRTQTRVGEATILYTLPVEGESADNDATQIPLAKAVDAPGARLRMVYGCGDAWSVTVRLERISHRKFWEKVVPEVVDGRGGGIPESCAGPEALQKTLDSTAYFREGPVFDVETMRLRVKSLPQFYRVIYEKSDG